MHIDGTFLLGMGICLLAAGVVLSVFRNGRHIGEVYQKVTEIDHAVNGKAVGQSSISQDVTIIKDKQELDQPSSSSGDAVLPLLQKISLQLDGLTERTKE